MRTNKNNDIYAIYRDGTGRLCIEAGDHGNPVVADFLFTDVRENPAYCDELLSLVQHARHGETGLEAVGNVYALILSPAGARLENIHDETAPAAKIGLDELQALLQAWRDHLD